MSFDPTSGEFFCLNCCDTGELPNGDPCPYCEEIEIFDEGDIELVETPW